MVEGGGGAVVSLVRFGRVVEGAVGFVVDVVRLLFVITSVFILASAYKGVLPNLFAYMPSALMGKMNL